MLDIILVLQFHMERIDIICKGWMTFGKVECDYKLMDFIWKGFMWYQELGIHLKKLRFHLQDLNVFWMGQNSFGIVEYHMKKLDLICKTWMAFGEVKCDLQHLEFIGKFCYFICECWMAKFHL